MKLALGIIVDISEAYGEGKSCTYDYGVELDEGMFIASNGDDLLMEEDIGKPVLIQYEPQDQFCKVIPLNQVTLKGA